MRAARRWPWDWPFHLLGLQLRPRRADEGIGQWRDGSGGAGEGARRRRRPAEGSAVRGGFGRMGLRDGGGVWRADGRPSHHSPHLWGIDGGCVGGGGKPGPSGRNGQAIRLPVPAHPILLPDPSKEGLEPIIDGVGDGSGSERANGGGRDGMAGWKLSSSSCYCSTSQGSRGKPAVGQ